MTSTASFISDTPPAWTRTLSVADQIRIDELPDDMRCIVERYVRACGGGDVATPAVSMMSDEDMVARIADQVVDSLDIRSEVESAVRSALRRHRGGK